MWITSKGRIKERLISHFNNVGNAVKLKTIKWSLSCLSHVINANFIIMNATTSTHIFTVFNAKKIFVVDASFKKKNLINLSRNYLRFNSNWGRMFSHVMFSDLKISHFTDKFLLKGLLSLWKKKKQILKYSGVLRALKLKNIYSEEN